MGFAGSAHVTMASNDHYGEGRETPIDEDRETEGVRRPSTARRSPSPPMAPLPEAELEMASAPTQEAEPSPVAAQEQETTSAQRATLEGVEDSQSLWDSAAPPEEELARVGSPTMMGRRSVSPVGASEYSDGYLSEAAMQNKFRSKAEAMTVAHVCNRSNHQVFLRDRVYAKRCRELSLAKNSGVTDFLTSSATCFCNLEVVSFRDLMLGDRGIVGVLSLFRSARRLRALSLAGNNLGRAGLRRALGAVQEPGMLALLSVIDLSHNPMPGNFDQDLLRFLAIRKDVLLLGLEGTPLHELGRQRLLRRSLELFSEADPEDMCAAWQFASDSSHFMDRQLWLRCEPLVEKHCSQELIMEYVGYPQRRLRTRILENICQESYYGARVGSAYGMALARGEATELEDMQEALAEQMAEEEELACFQDHMRSVSEDDLPDD